MNSTTKPNAVFLPPADARAAFERGSVDAWAVWDPYYAAAEVAGRTRVLATSRGLTNNNTVYLASPVGPITPQIIAEQQRVADAFFKLQLIPRPIRVADIVWPPGAAQLAQTSR